MTRSFYGTAAFFLAGLSTVSAQSRPPAQINVENRRAAMLTEVVIADAEGNAVARLNRPLAAGQKTVLRMTKAKGCDFTVQAKFDDEGEVDETLNLCREKVLRFTE
jgi:hypothetical protein